MRIVERFQWTMEKIFNEKVGFLFTCENKNNGGIATLYRTDDGG